MKISYWYIVIAMSSLSRTGLAGTLVVPAIGWSNFVFEPKEQEATPNYYGYGGRLSLGYSIHQVLDLAIYGQYIPGRRNAASTINPDAQMTSYGLQTGLRIKNALYIGVRGGSTSYNLLVPPQEINEVAGHWEGLGATGELGVILPASKQVFWQFSAEYGSSTMTRKDLDEEGEHRRLSVFSVMLSFVLNSDQSTRLESVILRNWVGDFF